jgi:multidrug efflux pump
MRLSDLSVTRPIFASVLSLILIIFGIVSFSRLPLREYPDIDPPIVTVETSYRGASAAVVETRITKLIEDRISGIEGIRYIQSSSQDGRSQVTIEFNVDRDIDSAANDIRDRVFGILDDLPPEADPPEIQKVDANEDVIIWLNLSSDRLSVPELTDYAERYLVDRFSVLDGVARVRIGGEQRYAMRVWVNRTELAARNLTTEDVENALRRENIELPAGSIESLQKQFTVRVDRPFRDVSHFERLVVARGAGGYLVRLGEVARVEKGTEEDRVMFRGNGIPMVGLGVIKQSTANTITVARGAKEEMARLNPLLPEGMRLNESYDSSVFVEGAIDEVYHTLFITILLVVTVIFLFLGSIRATIVPAVTVPVSILATFIVLFMFGLSINMLTLLALVLAIGMLVDDAIVVLENIVRRMQDLGESPLVAAFNGSREVAFAVIATTLVLVAVFVPISFLEGSIGKLFLEFAITMSAAVCFSSLVALSLSPMIASKVLRKDEKSSPQLSLFMGAFFKRLHSWYHSLLARALARPRLVLGSFVGSLPIVALLLYSLPSEYTPKEDRGAFFVQVNGPEGASYQYLVDYMDEIERRLLPLVGEGGIQRLLVRAPRGFGGQVAFNTGLVICTLRPWGKRPSAWELMDHVSTLLSDLPGVRAFPVMRQGFGGGIQKPVQFVIGGGTYEQLAAWRDTIVQKVNEANPGFVGLDWDYKETKPQIRVQIQYDRAADLGVSVETIGKTLETMLGSRRATTYIEGGEEYEVLIEGERDTQRTAQNVENTYVRSQTSGQLIPLSNLVNMEEVADSSSLNRYNRVRSVTLEANLSDRLSLGDALSHLEQLVTTHLPEEVVVDYKGQSKEYKSFGSSVVLMFGLGILVVFLVLAAQFESYIHPLVIILTVPLATLGGLLGLAVSGGSLNIYTQVALIILIGIATKNGILIVEFINQLRDRGTEFMRAIQEASEVRLRPVLMTAVTTVAGAVPLLLASGPGSETRATIGCVVFFGVSLATLFTLFLIPVAYSTLAKNTGSPGDVARRLEAERPSAHE